MVILPYNGKKKLTIVNSKQGKILVGSTGLEWEYGMLEFNVRSNS